MLQAFVILIACRRARKEEKAKTIDALPAETKDEVETSHRKSPRPDLHQHKTDEAQNGRSRTLECRCLIWQMLPNCHPKGQKHNSKGTPIDALAAAEKDEKGSSSDKTSQAESPSTMMPTKLTRTDKDTGTIKKKKPRQLSWLLVLNGH